MKNCQTIEKMLKISPEDRSRASKVVARSFYRMLRRNGFSQSEIMTFAGQLLDEVIRDMKKSGKDRETAPLAGEQPVRADSLEWPDTLV